MKKLFLFLSIVVAFSLSAKASDIVINSKSATLSEVGGGAKVITDPADGYCLKVNSSGAALVAVTGGISGSFTVTDVTVSALVPGVTATALGKAEDAAHSSGDTGVQLLTVRKNTAAATSGSDGDYQPLITDTNGKLWVTLSAIFAEDAAHTTADAGINLLVVRSDTAATTAGTDLDYCELISDENGLLWVNAGSVTPGTAAANLGKAEDAAHTTGDTLVAIAGVRRDVCATSGATDGDYVTINLDATGHVYSVLQSEKAEDAAHSSADMMMAVAARRIDTIASSGGTSGDYVTINQDADGYTAVVTKGMKAEDSGHTTADLVNPMGVVRLDTEASLCGADADYTLLQVDATGSLRTITKATQLYNTDFASTHYASLAGVVRRDANTTIASGDGKITPLQVNAAGQLKTSLVNVEKAEDAAESSGMSLIGAGAVRRDVCASSSGTSGDISTINVNSIGAVYTTQYYANPSVLCTNGDAVTTGINIVASAGGALKNRVYSITVTTAAAEVITVTELSGFTKIYTAAGVPQKIDFGPNGLLQTTAATAINATSADASLCQFVVVYSAE